MLLAASRSQWLPVAREFSDITEKSILFISHREAVTQYADQMVKLD